MPSNRTTPSLTTAGAFVRFQMVNALIWAAAVLGAAVVTKASDEFIYLLLVLVTGSTCSWAAIWRLLDHGGSQALRGSR